jgi:hypothetical protein
LPQRYTIFCGSVQRLGGTKGEYFEDRDQARADFKREVMERIYPQGWSKKTGLTQADLDEMAGALIHHKWACLF